MPNQFGRYLIIIGLLISGIGIIVYFKGSIPIIRHLGKLPGDIAIKRENFSFYFPLATSILISILLSLLFILFKKLR